jgi:hypothetical protein
MHTDKPTTVNTTVNTTGVSSYRLVFRGKNKAGKYMRAVRHVMVANTSEAFEYLAILGADMAASMPFDVAYTNVFAPCNELVPINA